MQVDELPFNRRISHQNDLSHPSLTAIKLYRNNQLYKELNRFREKFGFQLGGSLLYSSAKKRVTLYRLIFAGLAAFFIFLAACLWGYTLPFATGILSVSESFFIKNILGAVSALFGGAALCLGTALRPEGDVAAHLLRKAQRQLNRHYQRKKMELGSAVFVDYGVNYAMSLHLQVAYEETLGQLRDYSAELAQLFEYIAHSPGMKNSTKEHLYNQALSEFSHKIARQVDNFKNEFCLETRLAIVE